MSLEPSLHPEVARPIRRTIILLAARIFVILFIVDGLYASLLALNASGYISAEWAGYFDAFLWIIYSAKFVLLTYSLLRMIIDWTSTLYYVNGGHLIRQRGVLHTVDTVYQLSDIESVVMDQSWVGKLFNFGNITITFVVARQRENITLYAISDPDRFETIFSKYV